MVKAFMAVSEAGLEGREALIAAVDASGYGGSVELSDDVKVRRMEKILRHPDVKLATRGVFAEAGFEITDAVETLIGHIRGDFTDGEGKKIPPSLAALKLYWDRAMPSEPKRMHVLTARVGTPREPREGGAPPPMAARPVGEVIPHES